MYENKVNMLLLTKRFPPLYTGGVPNFYYNLIKYTSTSKIHLFTEKSDGDQDSKCDQKLVKRGNCCIRRLSCFPEHMGLLASHGWLGNLVRMVHAMINYIRENRIDLIMVGQSQIFLVLAAFVVGEFTRKSYVLFLHGEEIPQIPMKSNGLLRWLYQRAGGYFCNSYFTAERLKCFAKFDNISSFIINPGVEDRFFKMSKNIDDVAGRLNLGRSKIIYTIARLDNRKGQDMVIRALPAVLEKHPDTLYLIGGKGPMQKDLEKLVDDMSLRAHVQFLGFVSDKEIVAYHDIGDVFIMPNRILDDGDSEGFGIVFLEANAAGNPVIGGNEGGSVDAIVDGVTGLLVNPRSEQDIAEKICYLLDNDEIRYEMGQVGKKRCQEKFRWPVLAAQFDDAIFTWLQSIES